MRYLLLLFVLTSSMSFAQTSNNSDSRLLSKYSKEELKKLQKDSPEEFNYLNYYVANCYKIMELPSEKGNAHEIKGTLSIKSLENINIYDLKLETKDKDYQYYKIEGTTKLLVILSNEQIKNSYKTSK